MKSVIEFFKNFRKIIKILQFVSECLTSFAEIYNKYFPESSDNKEVKKVEGNSK